MDRDATARNTVADALAAHGLAAFTGGVLPHVRSCFGLIADGEEEYARTGNSRLFGDPDLPEGFPWPKTRGRWPGPGAQIFLAQIDLGALPHASADLPRAGLLSFYMGGVDGCGPVEVDVHYFSPGGRLVRRAHPEPAWSENGPGVGIRLAVRASASLPWRAAEFRELVDEMEAAVGWEAVFECEKAVRGGGLGVLLGHAHGFGRTDPRTELAEMPRDLPERSYSPEFVSVDALDQQLELVRAAEARASTQPQDPPPQAGASCYADGRVVEDPVEPGELTRIRARRRWLEEERARFVDYLASAGERAAEAADIARVAAQWRCLLRVDENEDAGFCIHPSDAVFFLITEAALARASFNESVGFGCSSQ